MEDFASGWCKQHFSFPGMYFGISASFYQAEQAASVALSEWLPAEPSIYPPSGPVPSPPAQVPATSLAAGLSPSESSDRRVSAPDPSTASEDPVWGPGPVEEAPADRSDRAGYVRLLLATEAHRRELQRRRRAEQAPPPLQLSADTERLRQQQMRRLYGPAAERVAAAEGRAQLQFDTITDRHRPPLWPNIPLKMRFD